MKKVSLAVLAAAALGLAACDDTDVVTNTPAENSAQETPADSAAQPEAE